MKRILSLLLLAVLTASLLALPAQAAAPAAIPHLQMVASADVCEPNEIHPPTKSRLAERIAALL